MKYYDGTKLLSMKDLNGSKPEIYITTSNRSAGKTTYYNHMAINGFLKKKYRKILWLYRYDYEIKSGVSDKIFKDLHNLFFHNRNMIDKAICGGVIRELYLTCHSLEPVPCGYAIAINKADQIKKYSHLLSDVDIIIFDEFQSENNQYANNEVEKFISIHTSIARGNGEQVRYVPVIMISNPITIINPYYISLGVSHRLQSNTKFLRGNGYVLEQGFNESASNAQKQSAFNLAFADNRYTQYASEAIYLNDNKVFIDKPKGANRYVCTLKYKGNNYGVRHYIDEDVYYCDDSYDINCRNKIACTTNDHAINYTMLKSNTFTIMQLRQYFECGMFRFKNLNCKECVMVAVSYV